MGGSRWFNIESKSFEFALEGTGVRIIERGRNSVSNITLGKEGTKWLGIGMAAIVKLSPEQSFVRTHREEGRVFILQKNKNDRGRFVSVTEYGAKHRMGSVVIPEGHDRWGWRGFNLALNGVMGKSQPAANQASTSRGLSRPTTSENGNGEVKKGEPQLGPQVSLSFKNAIMSDRIFTENNGIQRDTSNKRDLRETSKPRASQVELMLKINLFLGPSGNWEVSEAKIIDPSVGAQPIIQPVAQQSHQGAKAKQQVHHGAHHVEAQKTHGSKIPPKREWRPRSISSTQTSREPSPSAQTSREPPLSPRTDPTPSLNLATDAEDSQMLSATLRRLGSDTENDVQIAGDATKWLLRLRDGRSLVLPAACFCRSGVMHGTEDSDQAIVPVYDGDTPEISENWSEEDSVLDSVTDSALETYAEVEQMPPHVGEQSPLMIEPIAISYPSGDENKKGAGTSASTHPEASNWALEKYEEFGAYLGASYEGYEAEVMNLLCAIDRSGRKEDTGLTPKPASTKKGTRELKNLISTINYEGGSSKRQTVNSGGSLLLTCQ
jgi:hypothetical protein